MSDISVLSKQSTDLSSDLAALVGSRICHDLISPIGAIGNGVELLSLTDNHGGAEMSLISESVQNANARIRYFRIAFGAAAPDQMVGRAEIQSILAAMALGGRFSYQWNIEGDQPRPLVRCAFLFLLCLETALPLGGSIRILQQGDAWVMQATGKRIAIDPDLWASLKPDAAPYPHSAAQVQFALLPQCLTQAGRVSHQTTADDQVTIRF